MKFGLIVGVILLVLIPTVSAEILISGPMNERYNFGDNLKFEGYVSYPQDAFGLLYYNLDCGNKLQLSIKNINLIANEKILFSESIKVPSLIQGTCTIGSDLYVNGLLIESASSKSFTITPELTGKFNIAKTKIQLGDVISISGMVTKLDGNPATGLASIYLKKDGTVYYSDIAEVTNGVLRYSKTAQSIPAGVYDLVININELYNNVHEFSNITTIEIIDELNVNTYLDSNKYRPKAIISINGDVKSLIPESVKQGDIVIRLDNEKYTTTFKDGLFSYKVELKADVTSGEHIIYITASDRFGSKGINNISFILEPLSTMLKIDINKQNFNPLDLLAMKLLLYDQASELVDDSGTLTLVDPDEKEILKTEVKTNEDINYTFSQFDLPGAWTIKGYAGGLNTKTVIYMGSVSSIELSLDNQSLIITNTGNVLYDKPVEIKLDGTQDKTIIKKTPIAPNQASVVDLGEGMVSGTYDINVKYDDQTKAFPGVNITGIAVKSNLIYYLGGIVIIILLLYVGYKYLKSKPKKDHYVDLEKHRKNLDHLRELKHEDKPDDKPKEGFFNMFGWK